MILGQRLTKFQNTMGNKLLHTAQTMGNKHIEHSIHQIIQQHKPKLEFSNLERYNNRKKLMSQ